jgi:hypothetical protein
MKNTDKLESMLESSGYKKGSVTYNNAFKQAKYHMDKAEEALKKIANADFDMTPPAPVKDFDKKANTAEGKGQKNTVKKGDDNKNLAKPGKKESEGVPTPDKGNFDTVAKKAESEGKKNTVDKGDDNKNLAKPDKEIKLEGSFDSSAKKAEDTGKKNTVKKGKGAKKLAKGTKTVSEDVPAPKKGKFDDVAKKAEGEGKKNTVKKGKESKKLGKKPVLESEEGEIIDTDGLVGNAKKLLVECQKHAEFIGSVRSYNDGTPERSAYLEGIVGEFVKDHDTQELLSVTQSYLEATGDILNQETEEARKEEIEAKKVELTKKNESIDAQLDANEAEKKTLDEYKQQVSEDITNIIA